MLAISIAVLFLAVVALGFSVNVSDDVDAAEFMYDGVKYNVLSGDTVEVVANNPRYSGEITIPPVVQDSDGKEYSVVSIKSGAFSGCYYLTVVTIPDSVVSIGSSVFEKSSVESVTIPDSVTSMSLFVFKECNNLTSVILSAGVTELPRYTFYRCGALESVTIPDGVTSIGKSAFYYCPSLVDVTIPDGVTEIKSSTFRD